MIDARQRSRTVRAAVLLVFCTLALAARAQAAPGACDAAGGWVDPASGARVKHAEVLSRAADHAVVLLGETHDDPEHHRWQLSALAGLRAHKPDLVIGFEAFPRRVQPVLERWVAGELDTGAFLEASDWRRVWTFDPDLYMPLFDFARLYRLPMLALNVERSLVAAVGEKGWDEVPEAQREGIGDPVPASEAYRLELAEVYRQHKAARRAQGHGKKSDADKQAEPELETTLADPAFGRFVEAQLTWDRAMAEALAAAHRRKGGPTVVGIVGSGHLSRRHGIAHQLAALGIDDVMVLLPIAPGEPCKAAQPDLADALFVLSDRREAAPRRARLGVFIETAEGRVRIRKVVDDTVASRAGLADGDIVLEAAGVSLSEHGELVALIQRQAPGTWLPLVVERDGERMDVIAKFPVKFE